MSLRCPQLLAFKKADLEVEHGDLFAYTPAPPHHLKSMAASVKRFLGRSMNQKPWSTQPTDTTPLPSLEHTNTSKHNVVQEVLQFELDSYLHEPRMEPFKIVSQGSGQGSHVVWCDPLRYWMACILSYLNAHFSPVCVGI